MVDIQDDAYPINIQVSVPGTEGAFIGTNSDISDSVVNMPYYIGLKATVTEGSGVAQYIEAQISTETTSEDYPPAGPWTGYATAGLYEYVDYQLYFAGNLIKQTEVKTEADIPPGGGYLDKKWVRFNFLDPKPVLTQGTTYYLVFTASRGSGLLDLWRQSGLPNTSWGIEGTGNPMMNPMIGENASQNTYNLRLWYLKYV